MYGDEPTLPGCGRNRPDAVQGAPVDRVLYIRWSSVAFGVPDCLGVRHVRVDALTWHGLVHVVAAGSSGWDVWAV